jgi:S1-C subfamily serine protease
MDREPGNQVIDERPTPRPSSRRSWPRFVSIGLLVALVAVAIVVIVDRRSSDHATVSPTDVNSIAKAAVDKGIKDLRSAPPDSAVVYQAILPSLVLIRGDTDGNAGGENDLGTGVVINAAGQIITARHVVADAKTIRVTFADGTDAAARVVSQEPANDIAVLEADQSPETIVPAVIGGGVQVGDAAYAVGHPLGLVASLSGGVISGLDRSIPVGDGTTMHGLIQFDAAVNPGNSGGPLLNRSGQVVGIVTSLANPSGQGYFIGIGFAVPIGTASGAAGGPQQ